MAWSGKTVENSHGFFNVSYTWYKSLPSVTVQITRNLLPRVKFLGNANLSTNGDTVHVNKKNKENKSVNGALCSVAHWCVSVRSRPVKKIVGAIWKHFTHFLWLKALKAIFFKKYFFFSFILVLFASAPFEQLLSSGVLTQENVGLKEKKVLTRKNLPLTYLLHYKPPLVFFQSNFVLAKAGYKWHKYANLFWETQILSPDKILKKFTIVQCGEINNWCENWCISDLSI